MFHQENYQRESKVLQYFSNEAQIGSHEVDKSH